MADQMFARMVSTETSRPVYGTFKVFRSLNRFRDRNAERRRLERPRSVRHKVEIFAAFYEINQKFLHVEFNTVPHVQQFAGLASANISSVGQKESRLDCVSQVRLQNFAEKLIAEFGVAQGGHN